MHEVLVNRLGGLSLPRKSVVRLTDRPDMTLDVYRGRKTALQQQQFYDMIMFYICTMFYEKFSMGFRVRADIICFLKFSKAQFL